MSLAQQTIKSRSKKKGNKNMTTATDPNVSTDTTTSDTSTTNGKKKRTRRPELAFIKAAKTILTDFYDVDSDVISVRNTPVMYVHHNDDEYPVTDKESLKRVIDLLNSTD